MFNQPASDRTPRDGGVRIRRGHLAGAATLSALLVLSGCGGAASDTDTDASQKTDRPTTIKIATHDSWNMDEKVVKAFEKESGITVKIQKMGDSGELTNKLVLTKDAPLVDGVYGINNPFAARALENEVLAESGVEVPESAYKIAKAIDDDSLVPIDYSDVCVNIDKTWFTKEGIKPPTSLDDLTDEKYRGLFVAESASTSAPGLAFLLATVKAQGEDWESYWKSLIDNDAKVVKGWEEAYYGDFTAGGDTGKRPIVVSYSSSPPFTIPEGNRKPTTKALLDTCFRDVEYAGIVDGTDKADAVAEFLEFMLGEEFQSALPDQMYVYPIDGDVALPKAWAKWAPVAPEPWVPEMEELAESADLIKAWREIMRS